MGDDDDRLVAVLSVRLQPRAKKTEVVGFRNEVLLVRVNAPPVDGKANKALCKLLAKRLKIAPSLVRIVRGQQGRDKTVELEGITATQALARLT